MPRIRRMLNSQVECVEPSLLPGSDRCPTYVVHVSLPYSNVLVTRTCIADCHIFVFTDSLGLVHTRDERELSCPHNPLVDLFVQGEVVSDGGAEVGELADNIEFIVVDGNDRRFFCVLSQDVVVFRLIISPKSYRPVRISPSYQ